MDKKSKMYALVAQWRESGLTRKVFTQQHGLELASFDYWCKKQYNEVVKTSNNPAFVEIVPAPDLFQPKSIPVSSGTNIGAQIELLLPGGLLIKIY